MAIMYSDRILFSFNGVNIIPPGNISAFSDSYNGNVRRVEGMSTDGNVPGFTKGNNDFGFNLSSFIPNNNALAPIDFSQFDYENTNVTVTVQASSKSFGPHTYEGPTKVYTGVVLADDSSNFAGVGSTGTTGYTFVAQTRTIY